MKCLVINADDFGYSRERNDGIIQCFKQHNISSTSLLVNGLAVIEAVQLAHQYNVPTGLHVNLTEGIPVGQNSHRTLTKQNGCFHGKIGFRQAVKDQTIDLDEVKKEIQSQIDKFQELMGYMPVHADGHQHIHVLPGVCEIFASVLKENGITATRIPSEHLYTDHPWKSSQQKLFMAEVVDNANMARPDFTKAGIWTTDSFLGLQTMGSDMTADRIIQQLRHVFQIDQSGCDKKYVRTCELMTHPGYITGEVGGCGEGPDDFSQSVDREHEMSILSDKKLLTFYKESGIRLSSFQECIHNCSVLK